MKGQIMSPSTNNLSFNTFLGPVYYNDQLVDVLTIVIMCVCFSVIICFTIRKRSC